MKFTFLHKSHKPQKIAHDPAWTDLKFVAKGISRKRFYADADGVLEAQLYLPTKFKVTGTKPGILRVRLVREPFRDKKGENGLNPTGYDERALVASSDDYARIRFFYQGEAQKGRKYRWQAQVLGDVEAEATGTHYAEFWRR